MISIETKRAVALEGLQSRADVLARTEDAAAVAAWLAHWTAEIATGDPDELTFEWGGA